MRKNHRYEHSITARELIEFLEELNPDTEIYAHFPDNDIESPNIEINHYREENLPGIAYLNINDLDLHVRDTTVDDPTFIDDDDEDWDDDDDF